MEDLDLAIRRHRTDHATITLEQNGLPAASRLIRVEQKSHKLLLGANWGNPSVSWPMGSCPEGRKSSPSCATTTS